MSIEQKIIQDIQNILLEIKNKYIVDITNGERFHEIYREARVRVGDYIMTLPDEYKELNQVNNENLFLTFCSVTMFLTLEISVESLVHLDEFKRSGSVFDEINHTMVDFNLNDYSLNNLINQSRFSKHSFRRVMKAVEECYSLRSTEGLDFNQRYFSSETDFYITDFIAEEHNIAIDPYKHNPNDEFDDLDNLESSYDDDDDDKESELNIRWQNASYNLYQEVTQFMVKDFIEKYKIELGLGLLFDEIYEEFIIKFRLTEEKHHPYDKLGREKPVDVFLYFCDHVFNIDVSGYNYNSEMGFLKQISANKGNGIVIDNLLFKKVGEEKFSFETLGLNEVISNIDIVSMTNFQDLYDKVREIYRKRQNI